MGHLGNTERRKSGRKMRKRQRRFHRKEADISIVEKSNPLTGTRRALPLKGLNPLRRLAPPMLLSPSPFPAKKRTSHNGGSSILPEFVPKNLNFQIWRNDFGAKNGAQAKQRVEAYLTYARVFVIARQLVFSPKAFAKSGVFEF